MVNDEGWLTTLVMAVFHMDGRCVVFELMLVSVSVDCLEMSSAEAAL